MRPIHGYLFLSLFALFLFMFLDSLAYLFPYHEQQQLFLYSRDYLEQWLAEPGGMGGYVAAFVTQFFYLPLTGKILFALLLSAIYLLPALLLRRLTGREDPLQLCLLPVLYLCPF